MSLINQVLQDLDKRGASTNIGEATIRVVHAGNRANAFWLVAAGAIGMLVVAGAAWMLWHSQQPSAVIKQVAVPAPQPAVVVPVSQAVVAPVLIPAPRIDSVTPEQILATGVVQAITINGGNFQAGATVTLSEAGGPVYANRPVVSFGPEKIILNLNFGKQSKSWMLEVVGADGVSSGQYKLVVKAPVVKERVAEVSVTPPVLENKHKNTIVKSDTMAVGKLQPGVVMADGVSKQPTQITVQQQAENEYRRAYQLMIVGRNSEALAGFDEALKLDAGHELARQSKVTLLLERKSNTEAESVLQEGLRNNIKQSRFAMLLARLQVERNALPLALDTLMQTLPYAENQAEYLSFVAALLQRLNRNKEAIDFYHKALRLKPQSGVWLMGLGISLRAEKQNAEAREAYKRAMETDSLSAELRSFVTQQLNEL